MSIVFIAGILAICGCAVSLRALMKRHEKHDRVLFRFYQIQRDVMAHLRACYTSQRELQQQEFQSAELLLDMLDKVIRYYRQPRTATFNPREMRQAVARDLAHYRSMEQEVQMHLSAVPSGKMTELYADFERAMAEAFLIYTPLAPIVMRLLWTDLAKPIAQIRREAGSEKFA